MIYGTFSRAFGRSGFSTPLRAAAQRLVNFSGLPVGEDEHTACASEDMGGCQNYGLYGVPWYNTAPSIEGTKSRPSFLTTTHMGTGDVLVSTVSLPSLGRNLQQQHPRSNRCVRIWATCPCSLCVLNGLVCFASWALAALRISGKELTWAGTGTRRCFSGPPFECIQGFLSATAGFIADCWTCLAAVSLEWTQIVKLSSPSLYWHQFDVALRHAISASQRGFLILVTTVGSRSRCHRRNAWGTSLVKFEVRQEQNRFVFLPRL